LKADRSLVAWGANGDGQCDVPAGRDFVRIAAGSLHGLALRANGTLVAWGRNSEGQCRIPAGSDFVAISAGAFHSLALLADGHVEAWGQNNYAQCDTPAVDNVAIIAAGGFHSVAIRDNRPRTGRPAPVKAPAVKRTTPAPEPKGASTVPAAAPQPQPAPIVQLPPAKPPVATPAPDKIAGAIVTTPVASEPTPPAVSDPGPVTRDPGPASPRTGHASGPAEKPAAPTVDPNLLADLNDPVRQGLTANLYLDSGARAVPVYHFTSIASTPGAGPKQHFCTISDDEKYKLIDTQAKLWKYEGIAFFAYTQGQQPPDARPVHRFRSESLNRYFFTMDEAQKQMIIDKLGHVWKYQGVAWYAPPIKASQKK